MLSSHDCEWDLAWNHSTSYSMFWYVLWNDLHSPFLVLLPCWRDSDSSDCLLSPSDFCWLLPKARLFLKFHCRESAPHLRQTFEIHTHNKNRAVTKFIPRFVVCFGRMFCHSGVGKSLKWSVRYFTIGCVSFLGTSLQCLVVLRDVSLLWKGKRTL